jgi:hypothetical protein
MTSNEDILRAITGVEGKLDRFIASTVGSLDHENPQGRIPRLEAESDNYEERIRSLEDGRLRFMTITTVLSAVGGWVFNHIVQPFGK